MSASAEPQLTTCGDGSHPLSILARENRLYGVVDHFKALDAVEPDPLPLLVQPLHVRRAVRIKVVHRVGHCWWHWARHFWTNKSHSCHGLMQPFVTL